MTNTKTKDEIRIVKMCPQCRKRIFDKLTPATGTIEIKCPHCSSTQGLKVLLSGIAEVIYTE